MGGRKKKQARPHNKAYNMIFDDYFGRPEFTNGVVHEVVLPYIDLSDVYRRNPMGPGLFPRPPDEITDPDTKHEEFMRGPHAVGENGVDYSLLIMSNVSKCDVLLMTSTCLHE